MKTARNSLTIRFLYGPLDINVPSNYSSSRVNKYTTNVKWWYMLGAHGRRSSCKQFQVCQRGDPMDFTGATVSWMLFYCLNFSQMSCSEIFAALFKTMKKPRLLCCLCTSKNQEIFRIYWYENHDVVYCEAIFINHNNGPFHHYVQWKFDLKCLVN